MITERDLDEAIAECVGKRNPVASDCIKLAAFYTIRDYMYPTATPAMQSAYSPPPVEPLVDYQADSEFANAVDGKRQRDVFPVLDELMDTLAVINPRLHDAVIRKLY